jgi:anti-sigma regulatory factor (Ser/Thr protein kinase)
MNDDVARPRFAEVTTAFPTVPESVAAARRFVVASLRRFGFSPDALDHARLVTSELVANAFAAGRPPIRIRVRSVADGRAIVEVTQGSDEEPSDESDEDVERLHLTAAGRAVVESLATRWGTRASGVGVVAWFEVDDPAPPPGGSGLHRAVSQRD